MVSCSIMDRGKRVMMGLHVCYSIKDNCWNFYDSYGEICVHCGCCDKDPLKRAENRKKVLERWLDHWQVVLFTEVLDEVQTENVKTNIRLLKSELRYYKKRLEKLNENNKNKVSSDNDNERR